jgi:hypothetical protein
MKVDYFKDAFSSIPSGRPKDALFYLDRIRNGAVKNIVEEIRSRLTKEEKDASKKKLGAVTFGGTFSKRAKDSLKESSGLIVLDFDNLENVFESKERLSKDEFIFSCWISPSGNGLKALVRIPSVENDEEFKSFFSCIKKYFDWIEVDESGKDISRLCFESYDPQIYVNENSKLWVDFTPTEVATYELGVVTNIPVTDQDEIANRLMVWFKKTFNGQNRNNSFHKLALAFNDFGVSQYVAERYILPNEQKDFKKSEIEALINSAYKHTANFGSKSFEDTKKIKTISSLALMGRTDEEICNEFTDLNKDAIQQELSKIRKSINIEEFWYYDFEGKLKLSPHKFKFYLESSNYFKHYPIEKSKTFTFITKEDNFVDEVSEFQIKDFVLNTLLFNSQLDQFDLVANSTRLFTPAYLSMLQTASFQLEEDTKDYAMIYYRNIALRIWSEKIEKIKYSDLSGFVWKKQVIDRDYIEYDHHECEYRTFLWLASGKDKIRYDSLKSVIGYLMHSWKTSANNKAIIFNDETISDNPNGRSGKSLFWLALSHIKKVSDIDGKTFDMGKTFPYQTVPADTQLLVFDDVKKNFNFEALFALITGGITLEYKGQDAIKLPVQKSPKILITTNYTIQGSGGSFDARKFEIEMSNYFSVDHTPMDEFGHMLFDDWDDNQWKSYDNFMLYCLQFYLQHGLVKPNFKNLVLRKFINETSPEFYEFVTDGNIKPNVRYQKAVLYLNICEEYKDLKKWLSQKKLNTWIKKYADFKGYDFLDGNTNGQRWLELKYSVEPVKESDIWDELNTKAGY